MGAFQLGSYQVTAIIQLLEIKLTKASHKFVALYYYCPPKQSCNTCITRSVKFAKIHG